MNVNDPKVLEMINSLIAADRLSKIDILQIVNLASVSNNLKELKDNMKWETLNQKIK